jgi:membrane protease YdiL (CAAX protease family)
MKGTLLHLLTGLAFIAIAVIAPWLKKQPMRDALAWRRPPWRLFALFLAGFVLLVAAEEWIWRALGSEAVQPWRFGPVPLALHLFGVVMLAPFAEELLFRGTIYYQLTKGRCHPARGILVPALLFAVLHYKAGESELVIALTLGQTFLDGVYLGFVRYKTDSILAPVILHMLGNSFAAAQRMGWF